MEGPERVICCTLCLCMAVAVFSSVALVYLTALVYMPAKREINSGLSDVPVMCTTVARIDTDNCTDWYSCGEWCLSKSSHCTKIWAQVRKNGTKALFEGCRFVRDITCKVLDHDFVEDKHCLMDNDCNSLNERFLTKCERYHDCGDNARPFRCDVKFEKCVSVRQYRNCKMDDVCTNLDHLFICKNGLCENITSVYDCSYAHSVGPIDCRDKRNCITLQGLFDCVKGLCYQVEWPWDCERRCRSIPTDHRRNVILLSGDRMLSAQCDAAETSGDPMWIGSDRPDRVLMASCTQLQRFGRKIIGNDCVNGTLMPRRLLPSVKANYTEIHDIFQRHAADYALDKRGDSMPMDTKITIYNRTKVLINTEGCVNTLMYECTAFLLEHRKDGRNYTARDRFPCYYTPKHGEFVTTRFSVSHTKHVFFLSFSIPALLWVFSCSCLFGCSKLLRVEENGQMRIRFRKKLS